MTHDAELVGVTEIARRLRWDKRKVSLYVSRGLFPEPVAVLARGRVWRWPDVERVARERGWLKPRS